jgi:GT2 family glycosyltransferase
MSSPLSDSPVVSVVIPARHCADDLAQCLESLERSHYRDFEVIVVDDASQDDTTAGIDRSRVRVLVMAEQSGPGLARNRGAEFARGEYLLFLDADVCVHPETVGMVVETLEADSSVAAVFGSYDTEPSSLNVLSQYRNLMHHFVHQEAAEEACTFWTGCGAIRRSVFLEMGGFDPSYRRPCIEDIELGVRLRKAGYRIRLNKQMQVTHRKCWTFWGMLKADIRDRAFPWSQLILREGKLPDDLNTGRSHRASALLACGLVAVLLLGAWQMQGLLALPVLVLMGISYLDAWSLTRRVPTSWRLIAVAGAFASVVLLAFQFQALVLIPIAMLGGIILLNWRFYYFLAKTRQPLFALLAVPLHVLYYLYSVGTFSVAAALHVSGRGHPMRPLLPHLGSQLASEPRVEREHPAPTVVQ